MEKIVIQSDEKLKSEIFIVNDLIQNISEYVDINTSFLITNEKLAKLYPHFVYKFNSQKTIIIKDGEKYKNFKTCNYILENLLKNKIERKSTVVAFGGGVVGDMSAYCASVILRGVNLVQIPTTLLAMCDSSIGGKTGYNTKFGKNLIGTFYLASKVLIDTEFLETLNDYEYHCGLGEILKYAFIEKSCKNDEYYDLIGFLTKNQTQDIKREMPYLINACANLKANVVRLDRLEGNLRKILNFGHTYAHAFETLSNYKKFSHGEAVAYGIRYASLLAYNLNYIDENYYNQIISLLDKFNLAKKKIRFKKSKVIELMKQDKKVENGKINLLLPFGYQEIKLFDNIDLLSLEASLPWRDFLIFP